MTRQDITHPHVLGKYVMIIVILSVTTIAYANIFRNGFVIDDRVFIGSYHPGIAEAFRGAVPPGHEGVYRPVRGIIYTAYYSLFGTNPFWYHLHSLIVHLAATVLVYLIIFNFQFSIFNENFKLRNENSNWLPFVASLLFGLHPVHTESITYIASSMDVTGIVFFLAAFYAYLRAKNAASLVFAIFAFLTNEITLTLPLIIGCYEFFRGGAARKALPYGIGAIAYLGIRFILLGITSRGVYLSGSAYYTLLTLPKVFMHYLWVTVWPVGLMNNHIVSPGIEAFVYRGYRTAAILGESILDPEILFSITVITIIIFITVIQRKKYPLLSFGIAWFFIALLPVMGLVPQGSIFNERMLYIPSVGFVMILASIFYNFYNRYNHYNRYIWAGIILVFMLYGVRTAVRNADWHDDVTLWQKDVASAPTENAYAYFAMGNAYYNRKEYGEAAAAYEQSVAINPGFAVGYASLSRTYRDMGNVARSNAYYQKADEAEPGFWSRP